MSIIYWMVIFTCRPELANSIAVVMTADALALNVETSVEKPKIRCQHFKV